MRRIGASILLGLVISTAWAPSATAEETPVPSESPSLNAPNDLPTFDPPSETPTASPTQQPTEPPGEQPTEPPSEPAAEPPNEPTDEPSSQPTSEPSTEPTTEPPGASTASPSQPPDEGGSTRRPATVLPVTSRQAVASAFAVISPIRTLTMALFGSTPQTPVVTSTPTASAPVLPIATEGPSPSESPDTTDVALSGSEAAATSGGLPWGGLVVILLCGAAAVIGYSMTSRGGSHRTGRP